MRTALLTAHIFAAFLSYAGTALTLHRFFLNQAADRYSDDLILPLLLTLVTAALFTALTIRTIERKPTP